jgi:preprotein translocase subunit SecG
MSTTAETTKSKTIFWCVIIAVSIIICFMVGGLLMLQRIKESYLGPGSSSKSAAVISTTGTASQKAELAVWITSELALFHAHHTQINANRQQYHDAAQMEITHPGAKRGWDILFGIIDGKLKNQSKYIALAESVVKNAPKLQILGSLETGFSHYNPGHLREVLTVMCVLH